MRAVCVVLAMLYVVAAAWSAQPSAGAPYEIVKDHTEIEVAADGTGILSRQQVMRALDERGIALLHEQRLGMAGQYQDVRVVSAYTLKANGDRIPVPQSGYLTGYGQTSQPGFQDNTILSIFFPNLEVGDSIVLLTVHRQTKPWFTDRYDLRIDYSRRVPAHDVAIAVTAPVSLALAFDDAGLTAGAAQTMGTKIRKTWTYRNDIVEPAEIDSVDEDDYSPRLVISSFADYAQVARAYAERSQTATDLTPEIKTLADQLTAGIVDRREQTRRLYEWVASHIAYVGIVLGAGGFTPHDAKDVLANRYGDCKDHVVLLEALLKAKAIKGTAVLIRIGAPSFALSPAAIPHAFDHVITYVPEFDLYLDSTAALAPFAVLPFSDQGKPVLHVATGLLGRTPVTQPDAATIKTVGEVRLDKEGAADAQLTISATGALGVDVRQLMRSIAPGDEQKFLSEHVGPGADGRLERGDPAKLSEPYIITTRYHMPGAIVLPGPGALPTSLALRFFALSQLIASDLPPSRQRNYTCPSLSAIQQIRYVFPEDVRLISIPQSQELSTDGVKLRLDFDRIDPQTLLFSVNVRISHAGAICTPGDYAKTRPILAKMLNALKEQIIYRGPKGGDK